MKDIINKLESLYNELVNRETALKSREEGCLTRKRALDDQEKRLSHIANDLAAKERIFGKIEQNQKLINESVESVREAKRIKIEAYKKLEEAQEMNEEVTAARVDLANMQALYRKKVDMVEQQLREIEARKANLRKEVMEELKKKLA